MKRAMPRADLAAPRRSSRPLLATGALLVLALGLSACGPMTRYRGTALPAQNQPEDSRGVITYATYQVAVARDGDTIDSVAARVGGTTGAEIAARNALPIDYPLRAGEVLLLPDSVPRGAAGGFATDGGVTTQPLGWTPEGAAAAIDSTGAAATGATAAGNPFQNGQKDPLIDPVRHRVEAGETAYSIARLYGVSTTALASWNGLGPDMGVRVGQELLIPIASGANRIPDTAGTQPGQGTVVAPPPSAAAPLPDDLTTTAATPASPNLGAQRTPAGGKLRSPVSGKVARAYNSASPNGVGFAVPAGTPVKAAASGEVALISEELGGLGTIVLIRHPDDLLTTYSTLSDVTVKKGDKVSAGQVIGKVAPRDKPELQFDVFRGTTSVDPTPYIGG